MGGVGGDVSGLSGGEIAFGLAVGSLLAWPRRGMVAMMRGWTVIAAAGAMLAACGEQAAVPHVPEPAPEPVSVPEPQSEWSVVSGRYPALTYSPKGQVEFLIGCEEATIKVATRAFEPVQAWPQPRLELGCWRAAVFRGAGCAEHRQSGAVGNRVREFAGVSGRDGSGRKRAGAV